MLDGVKDTHLGVDGIEGVLSVDEGCGAALALHFCNSMHRQRRLAAALWTKHLHTSNKECSQATWRQSLTATDAAEMLKVPTSTMRPLGKPPPRAMSSVMAPHEM